MIRMSAAAMFFLLLTVPLGAQTVTQYDNNGRVVYTTALGQPAQVRTRSGGCPRHLGCGCNLANYFKIVGKKWRELWVARAWADEGSKASKGCVGCVAVLSRGRRGGHVGVVKSYDTNGNPIIYSYANGRLGWTTTAYPARRVIAYRSM